VEGRQEVVFLWSSHSVAQMLYAKGVFEERCIVPSNHIHYAMLTMTL